MDGQSIFAWVDFYQEFADKLLLYKNKRQELIEKVKRMFEMTGINMPLLEADNEIVDMDPQKAGRQQPAPAQAARWRPE